MAVLALIPARSGSKGIPGKNLRTLGGQTLIEHAVACARDAGLQQAVVSTDSTAWHGSAVWGVVGGGCIVVRTLPRPAELAQDDTPMLAVVQHALRQIPGVPDDIIVLLQPTQPLRKPAHIQQAIALLRKSGADSVVSVVEIPRTHSPECVLRIGRWDDGLLAPCSADFGCDLMDLPKRRQDVQPAYIRDGTVYAFWRRTVSTHNSIYGYKARPLIIDPADTCELDTMEQWTALERRWSERHAQTPRS